MGGKTHADFTLIFFFFLSLGGFWSIGSLFLFEKSGNLEEVSVSLSEGADIVK